MKLKAFFILIPALITAIVISALLLFSASWIQVAIAAIPTAFILYVTASQLWAKLVHPVSDLAEQTRPLNNGDLARLVVMNKEGEFGEIASNINNLVRKLREAQESEDRF